MGVKDAEWKLAQLMVDNDFDKSISEALTLGSFSSSTLPSVIALHEGFVHLGRRVTKRIENSFCSKYLSFHFPKLFPLFDRNAYNASWELTGHRLSRGLYVGNRNVDYAYHCEAILKLLTELHQHGVAEPDLKTIDYVLYSTQPPPTFKARV